MAIANAYNTNPVTVDSLLKERQSQYDLQKEQGLITEEPVKQQNQRFLGVEMTPDSENKSFLRKVGEDAALLAYAIPVGLAQAVTHPVQFVKNAFVNEEGDITRGAIGQSVRDVVDPDYYKAHPLLGIVNLAGFIAPIAGIAKSAVLKTATKTALSTALKEATLAGVDDVVARTALKETVMKAAVREAASSGKTSIAQEVVRTALSKAGVADDVALKVGASVADGLYTTFSRQTTKMKVLESIAHPFGSASKMITGKADPIRKALFGDAAKTAVGELYGADVVKKNPEGFLNIERWAEAQAAERGLTNTMQNRLRIMQDWVEQNSQWGALDAEGRIAHFDNYAKQDLIRLKIHDATGMDIVTTKSLPKNYVNAMVQTVKDVAEEDVGTALKVLEENFGNDYALHSAELSKATTKEALIAGISKLGSARTNISFAKFSPEAQALAKDLEKTGYRIGYAPTDKAVSYAQDILKTNIATGKTVVATADVLANRTKFGAWLDKLGLSARGQIEGAAEYSYRENFTQRALATLVKDGEGVLKAGKISIPVEKLFEWIEKNRTLFQQARGRASLPIRTVFDVNADDLVRAGFTKQIAEQIVGISKQSLREIPASITGMGDAVINYMRTSNKGFGKWMSEWYDKYLKIAYKGRYDWSPFFSAQQWLETKINSALLLKDARVLPGGAAITKFGNWTAEKLGKTLEGTKTYLSQVVDEPPLQEVAMVRDEVLGTLQKTMLDYTSTPDIVGVMNAAKGGLSSLKDKAVFEQSIRSRNIWYNVFKQSSVRMATTFNKALANKFGMTVSEALDYTIENGIKKYKNPQLVQLMREATQSAYHYEPGILTSPLMKTLNIIWFPLRFEVKTAQLASKWLNSLSPMNRMVVMNNWVHFANWAGTDEGREWRITNRNFLYNILAYTTAYEQIGQAAEAVTKGRLFGGNAGLIGGVPFGFVVNLARELAILPEDPDQFDPKTGKRFTKMTPRKVVSAASLSAAIEQLLISISPSTPFYSLTGGVISGVSPRKYIESLTRQVVGAAKQALEGRDPARGRQQLERDFKRVPLDFIRMAE